MKYITVLDFEINKVFQYKLPKNKEYEENLIEFGHNLNNCQWMVHKNSRIITK